ncbi:MAG: M28 family peptidase [Gemmatimonadales bacterium]
MTDYATLLRELAVPRLVGTPNHRRVREVLKRELAARGYSVEEHEFSGRPSRVLFGTPSVVHGVNLIASRPSDRPTVRPSVWLVAHYDSKGQPISMALRLAGAAALAVGAAGVGFALAAGWPVLPALALAVLGAIVLAGNRVTDQSAGAVDNASALVGVLMLLDLLPAHVRAGAIFSDAEELGLLGARALAADRAAMLRDTAVVNFDGLDDRGKPAAFLHRPGPVGLAVAAELGAARARWLPVLVDGIALVPTASECVTIMQGDWTTMRIVHTSRDTADRLTLAGARYVAEGVARALTTA